MCLIITRFCTRLVTYLSQQLNIGKTSFRISNEFILTCKTSFPTMSTTLYIFVIEFFYIAQSFQIKVDKVQISQLGTVLLFALCRHSEFSIVVALAQLQLSLFVRFYNMKHFPKHTVFLKRTNLRLLLDKYNAQVAEKKRT